MGPGQTVRWPLYVLIWTVTISFILSGTVDLVLMATKRNMVLMFMCYKSVESFVMYLLVIVLLRNLWELNEQTLQLVKKIQKTGSKLQR